MRSSKQTNKLDKRCRLIPDADFSRNVTFHVIEDPEGERQWIGRYLLDLLEVVAEHHPEGLVVEIEGILYVLNVATAPQGDPDG